MPSPDPTTRECPRLKARLLFRKRLKKETPWNDILKVEQGIYEKSLVLAEADRVEPDFDEVHKSKQVHKVKQIGKDYVYKTYPFRNIYRSVLWKTFNALVVHKSREALWTRIKEGFVKLSDIAKMSHADLDPEKAAANRTKNEVQKTLEIRTEKRDGKEVRIPYDISYTDTGIVYTEFPDSEIECRCGSRKISSYQQQTRSADEPMTIFANCLACGSRFRM